MTGQLSVISLTVGFCEANCYIAADSGDALIIDPGDNPESIIHIVEDANYSILGIVNTHCHGDHIAANGRLIEHFDCPLMIHELDSSGLSDPIYNLSALLGYSSSISPPADRFLHEGDTIQVGCIALEVIHTPGHSPGGICLYGGGLLFTGDTLFAGGVGRTDLPGGSFQQLMSSIKSKLLRLPDSTKVYPGHGPSTTIGHEKSSNPWMQ